MRGRAVRVAAVVLLVAAALLPLSAVLMPTPVAADLEPDEHGSIATLPTTSRAHWLFVPDRVLRHITLFDGDSGQALGTLDGTFTLSGPVPLLAPRRGEIYVVDQVYSRGHRGERKDFVTLYDAKTLAVRGEIEIPPRSASIGHGYAMSAVLDDDRFLVVFNQDPSNSVSVVDLEARQFVGEIVIGGCALVYPTGGRRFGTLCGNGTAIEVELDDVGGKSRATRSEPFFDTVKDPLTEKGVRDGARWYFASFEGQLHEIDFSTGQPKLAARWSLFTDAERASGWRVGGQQHLALHQPTRRLYSLVHEGKAGSHKDEGSKIWVYDLAVQKRVQEIEPPGLLTAFLRPLLQIAPGGWSEYLMRAALPNPGVHSIAVTQDAAPLLFARHDEIGAVGVMNALSGEMLREIEEVGISGPLLIVPPVAP